MDTTRQIIPTSTPQFVIVVDRRQSGVGHDLWEGAVYDTTTGQVVQVEQEVPVYSGRRVVMQPGTVPALRSGAIDRLDQLVETLRGLTPIEVAA